MYATRTAFTFASMLKYSASTLVLSPRSSTTHLPSASSQPSVAGISSIDVNSASTARLGCDALPHSLDIHALFLPVYSRRAFSASSVVVNTSGIASNATYGMLLPW